jgi:hypothetical protein
MHTRGGWREDNTQKKGDVIRKVKPGKAKEYKEKDNKQKREEHEDNRKMRGQREKTIEERI